METACSMGMLPNDFWEHEPSDTLIYIDSVSRNRKNEMYATSLLIAQMYGVILANAFREKGKPPIEFPQIHEVFPDLTDAPSTPEVDPFEKRIVQLRAMFAGKKVGKHGSNS